MPYQSNTGINVANHYGARETGYAVGLEQSSDSTFKVSVQLTGASLNGGWLPSVYVPKGALLKSAFLDVDEAFVVSTSGTVAVGGTVPGTNGIVLTEAKLEALGTSNVTSLSVGTWAEDSATGTTASQKVTTAITGTVGATAGKATLVMEFFFKSKAA